MPERNIPLDHDPSATENEGISRRVEKLGLAETLHDSSQRREFFSGIDNHEFKRMLGYVNSITRGQRHPVHEYEDGKLPLDPTPPMHFKEKLMDKTFETVRGILNDEELSDEDALETAGLTLAGSINMTHPYEDGNGRTGRLLHYIIQYGTERGERAFEEETYAIITKLPMYETDSRHTALYDTPPPEMVRELADVAKEHFPDYDKYSPRDQAVLKAKYFLEVMSGKENRVLQSDAKVRDDSPDRLSASQDIIPGGTMGMRDYYRLFFHRQSEIPNRDLNSVPDKAERVVGKKMDEDYEKMLRNMGNAITSEFVEV